MTDQTTTEIANTAQRAYWNESVGGTWAKFQDLLDRQIDGLGLAAMAALDVQPGETVLDIGCGCGQTSIELAERVGPAGRVTGVDISHTMLEVARARPTTDAMAPVEFIEADAQVAAFPHAPYDAVFSRFGVMFFENPTSAFTNIAKALKPGGRLAFVCWRAISENEWMSAPAASVADMLPATKPSDPYAPGPFAFADEDRLAGILDQAGFSNFAIRRHDALISAGSLDNQMILAFRVGPLATALRENPDLAPRVEGRVREALSRYMTPNGDMAMPASCWIVTAGL
jgi:SAM-dependent methyltransferase